VCDVSILRKLSGLNLTERAQSIYGGDVDEPEGSEINVHSIEKKNSAMEWTCRSKVRYGKLFLVLI
jgi:hypothetical protein